MKFPIAIIDRLSAELGISRVDAHRPEWALLRSVLNGLTEDDLIAALGSEARITRAFTAHIRAGAFEDAARVCDGYADGVAVAGCRDMVRAAKSCALVIRSFKTDP